MTPVRSPPNTRGLTGCHTSGGTGTRLDRRRPRRGSISARPGTHAMRILRSDRNPIVRRARRSAPRASRFSGWSSRSGPGGSGSPIPSAGTRCGRCGGSSGLSPGVARCHSRLPPVERCCRPSLSAVTTQGPRFLHVVATARRRMSVATRARKAPGASRLCELPRRWMDAVPRGGSQTRAIERSGKPGGCGDVAVGVGSRGSAVMLRWEWGSRGSAVTGRWVWGGSGRSE